MTISDDAPSMAERYATAISTSDLRVRTGGRKAADVIAASGMAGGCGAVFARARAEFDFAHSELRGKVPAVDARMIACTKMPSLKDAKAEAINMAIRHEWGLEPAVIVKMAWQALSSWLDPICAPCDGRGFTGGYDGPQVICTRCRGSGKRRDNIGKHDAERRLVTWLVAQFDVAVANHSCGILRALKST